MIIKYITFSISITFISWIAGMLVNGILLKTDYYERLSNLNFIKSKAVNKLIGIYAFKWVVKNTFFKFFNPKLKLKSKVEKTELIELRKEMTYAEINHLIGFFVVSVFVVIKLVKVEVLFAFVFLIVNTLMNLYPSLLQQENKRRIDVFITRIRK